jgi:hypothetical protein
MSLKKVLGLEFLDLNHIPYIINCNHTKRVKLSIYVLL